MMESIRRTAGDIVRDGTSRMIRLGVDAVELIPIDELLEHIPIEQLVARIPIEDLVARMPIETLIARIDINALVAQIDIEALLERIDIGRLVNEAMQGIDLEEIIRTSTVSVGGEVRGVARSQAMSLDLFVAKVVDGILRRSSRNLDVGITGMTPATS
jgi:hypothetical protein